MINAIWNINIDINVIILMNPNNILSNLKTTTSNWHNELPMNLCYSMKTTCGMTSIRWLFVVILFYECFYLCNKIQNIQKLFDKNLIDRIR